MDRRKLVEDGMQERRLDGFLALLPENILFFSGHWPSAPAALVMCAAEKPVLIIPKPDEGLVPADWKGDTWIYNTRLDDDPTDIYIAKLIEKAVKSRGLHKGRLGCDRFMETVAGTHVGGVAHVPGEPFYRLLGEVLNGVQFQDHTAWLYEMRMVKTAPEIRALKKCNEIVDHALAEARKRLTAGMKETEVSAIIESSIQTFGVGYLGVQRARGFAFVMSGPDNTAAAWGAYNISTSRLINEGDLVLIELDTQADGFWSDVSRTFVVGEPDKRQQEIWSAVRRSEDKTIASLKVGAKISTVDATARRALTDEGFGEHFLHHVGHGVGFAFHEMPYLDPPSLIRTDYAIEAGMVLAIEPALYFDGWGGIRVEDNVYITDDGAEYLSTSERSL
jgi:Xaa-Pro dipeptidase